MAIKDNEIRQNKYIELLSTNNKALIEQWKMQNGVQKEYDGQVKTFIFNVGGKSPLAQMYFPKDKKKKSNLSYPLLVFQLCILPQARILFNIGVTCHDGQRKRITLSTNQKSRYITSLFTTLPLTIEHFNSWIHVLVDVENIISSDWSNQMLKEIDFLSLSGVFRMKRIFLVSREMLHFDKGDYSIRYDQLPKQLSLPPKVCQNYKYISSKAESLGTESMEKNVSTPPMFSKSGSSDDYLKTKNIYNTEFNTKEVQIMKVENLMMEAKRKMPGIKFLTKKIISGDDNEFLVDSKCISIDDTQSLNEDIQSNIQTCVESPKENFNLSLCSSMEKLHIENFSLLSITPYNLSIKRTSENLKFPLEKNVESSSVLHKNKS